MAWVALPADRPARGALTAAPAGLGGAPLVPELHGLGRPGGRSRDPETRRGWLLRQRPRFTADRNRMGPGRPSASHCHEAQKWGLMGPEVPQVGGVRA